MIDVSGACTALQGARRDGMLKEMASYDTIGNAFFALTIHAVPLRWRYALVPFPMTAWC